MSVEITQQSDTPDYDYQRERITKKALEFARPEACSNCTPLKLAITNLSERAASEGWPVKTSLMLFEQRVSRLHCKGQIPNELAAGSNECSEIALTCGHVLGKAAVASYWKD